MHAIKLLEEQHDQVDALFAHYDKAEDSGEKLEVFNELADVLTAHATIEEKLFYPTAYTAELSDERSEAVSEHLRVKKRIAGLLELEPTDPQFDVEMKLLQEEVEAHVTEEEEELFPIVKQLLPRAELEALGESMEELYEDLIDGNPRNRLDEEDDEASAFTR